MLGRWALALGGWVSLLMFVGCATDGPAATSEEDDLEESSACAPTVEACGDDLPDLGARRSFRHNTSRITSATSFANHRGRDLFFSPGDDVWVIAKLAYGVVDKDLEDEEVDIYLRRDCGADWELVDTVLTTEEGDHPAIEGVEDTGGRVFFRVPAELELGPGRHRFELVVAGDLSHTSVDVDIVPPGQPIVVSDVDGTLTTSENAEFGALLTGKVPGANDGAPEVLTALADHGYRVMYLTARPEFLAGRTREFLATHGFPPGIVHTTLTATGATGSSAAKYKTAELEAIAERGLVPTWGFGNRDSDAQTYDAIGAETCVLYQWDDPGKGCRRIESYRDLLPEIEAADPVCP